VGALAAGIMLTRRPLRGMAGRKLLVVVGVFGASMIVFGLSHSFALSFAALAVSGFVDMISMNIRQMITALATPDALRGRVNAVEMVFISASNELGAFESGAAAALVGAVPAVVVGGCLTIAAALLWPRLFPQMAGIDHLESLHPAAGGPLQSTAEGL
jgi:MFS family permease